MTGKVINNSATGVLVLILPFALAIIFILTTWPLILGLFGLSLGWQIWQNYQWKQWSNAVNPYFRELIQENQGCLTALDLSIKANLSARGAQIFLDKKAEEYGAQRQIYKDQGIVYYFLTANALGSIFADSEPIIDIEGKTTTETEVLAETSTYHETSASEIAQLVELETKQPIATSTEVVTEIETEDSLKIEEETEEIEEDEENLDFLDTSFTESDSESNLSPDALQPLIQAELAKRLDVHSSTVGKRKSDPDFQEWSQSRDPDGVAWQYSRKSRMFIPIKDTQES